MAERPLLAKVQPEVALRDHLAEVTALGAELARRLRLPEPLRTKALIACALHDIGKATVSFQQYLRGERPRAYPHALASLPFVLVLEGLWNRALGLDPVHYEASATVLTHHSPLSPRLYRGYEKPDYHPGLPRALRDVWALLREAGVEGLPSAEAFWQTMQPLLEVSPAALLEEPWEVRGERRTLRGVLQTLAAEDFADVKAVLHLADWLASARRTTPRAIFLSGRRSTVAVERHVRGLGAPLRAFQREARRRARADVLWLRAPTGTGKTEALLLWADGGRAERLLYLLPTQATTDAMWRRLCGIYGADAVGLAHGRAAYVLRCEADEDPLDSRLFGSVFAKPVGVATLDQYLLAHLNGRHWEERRALARRATVVLDEIHAYEPYTLGLLLEALERERPARLALASATLPEPLLKLFPEGSLVEAEPELWHRRRHRLELRDGTLLEGGVRTALEAARAGRAVLVVANTVRDAQAFYERLREAGWARERRELLHARFILRDRRTKETRISAPGAGTIVVATQVVEVSLDISYDVLVTELAPVDALVQRMGRVNRRGEGPPVPVWVFRPGSEGAERVYGRELLEWSAELLAGLPPEPTDADWARVTHRLYERATAAERWRGELAEGRETLAHVRRTLGCYTIDLGDEELRARFTARRGTIAVEVLPEPFREEAYALKERGEGWRLPELLVPVPLWWLTRFPEAFAPVSDLGVVQTTLPYDPERGLRSPLDAEASEAQGPRAEMW